jgi:hypothetical protein
MRNQEKMLGCCGGDGCCGCVDANEGKVDDDEEEDTVIFGLVTTEDEDAELAAVDVDKIALSAGDVLQVSE